MEFNNEIIIVQRRAARKIMREYSYDYSVSQMLKDLALSSLENRRKISKLTLLYKISIKLLCIKEKGYLERADPRSRDASRNYQLKSAKIEIFKHSFVINTTKIWNNLPSVIKYTQSLEHFKTAVSQLFISYGDVTPDRSRTPWRDTYVGFCLYNEEEEGLRRSGMKK